MKGCSSSQRSSSPWQSTQPRGLEVRCCSHRVLFTLPLRPRHQPLIRAYAHTMVVLTYIFFVSHAAWKAPLAGFGSIEAKCVLPNQGCTAPAQGTSFVDASGKAKQGTVTGLSTATTYDCYVVADPKLLTKDKCSKPVRITTLASPTLVYR